MSWASRLTFNSLHKRKRGKGIIHPLPRFACYSFACRGGDTPLQISMCRDCLAHRKVALWAKVRTVTRMYHFYALNRAEFLRHYHKCSNIETTFHMIKSKFGQRLRSRTLTAQINEALCRCYVITSASSFRVSMN